MIYEANIHTREKLVTMFEDFNNVVLLSYLQGHMGTAWVNDLENPTVAQITALSERESPSPLGMG